MKKFRLFGSSQWMETRLHRGVTWGWVGMVEQALNWGGICIAVGGRFICCKNEEIDFI